MVDYLPIIFAWAFFGLMHSITASTPVKRWVLGANVWFARYYRLAYNGLSILTFLPVLAAYRMIPQRAVGQWEGKNSLGFLLIGLGIFLGLIALSGYDMAEFTGFPPRRPQYTAKNETLRQQGLLRFVRHPLYLAMILILAGLFVRQPSWANLVLGGFAFIYLRIGIYFEEQKLIVEFGDQYRSYKTQVPIRR